MEHIERRENRNQGAEIGRHQAEPRISVWHIVGGIALVGLVAAAIVAVPDLKRYIKISTM